MRAFLIAPLLLCLGTTPALANDTPVVGGDSEVTAGQLPPLGAVVEGTIDAEYPHADWFALTPPQGYGIHFTFIRLAHEPTLVVYREGNVPIGFASNSADVQELGAWKTDGDPFFASIVGHPGDDYILIVSVVPLCGWDAHEPNNLEEWTATHLVPDTTVPGTLCPDDVDYYQVYLEQGQTLVVELDFEHDDGDLGLWFWNFRRNVHRTSNGTTDHEEVTYTALWNELVLIGVATKAKKAQVDYELSVRIAEPEGDKEKVSKPGFEE